MVNEPVRPPIDWSDQEEAEYNLVRLQLRREVFGKYRDAPAEEPEVPSHAIWPGLKLKTHIGQHPKGRKSVRIASGHYPAPSEEVEAI